MLDTMLSNDILVYDWSGKCICRLVTDIKLFNICVTNDDKELIALGWDDGYHLYSFDLIKGYIYMVVKKHFSYDSKILFFLYYFNFLCLFFE